jgi:hypothetical protein
MYKLISSLALAFLIGCTATTAPSNAYFQPNTQLSQRDLQNPTTSQPGGGFVAAEAKQLLEFCIELNNQDDRNSPQKKSDSQYQAQPSGWKIVYDSRHPGNTEWNKNWPSTVSDPEPNNPEKNGFGPFNNAWLLVQSETEPTIYAIAVRGTVGEINSILADAFVTSTPTYAGIEYPKDKVIPILFAATPKSEVHVGFAYAAFTLLFEKDKGILTQLHKLNLPDNSRLLITGHSQGAAIATLVHSFLYYAITDPQDRYKLNLKLAGIDDKSNRNTIQLKSYVFAQPKPGNQQYSEDFARITKDVAYVINNDRDPVPQVPLSLQTITDVAEGVEEDNAGNGSSLQRFASHEAAKITELRIKIRGGLAENVVDRVAKKFAKKGINLSLDEYFKADEKTAKTTAKSLNYTLTGQLIPVFGAKRGGESYPIGDRQDFLLQHHATSYRRLMDNQFKNGEKQ